MLDITELTREQILEMSQEEIFLWAEAVQKAEAEKKAQRFLLDWVEIRDNGCKTIKLN